MGVAQNFRAGVINAGLRFWFHMPSCHFGTYFAFATAIWVIWVCLVLRVPLLGLFQKESTRQLVFVERGSKLKEGK